MLRSDLPFRRIAVVLSGGGAFGAYEVGVLRVLESLELKPAILAGTSAGAINAVVWLAHDFATAPLERVWRHMRSGTVGIRWNTLMIRVGGALVTLYALIQAFLTLIGSPGLTWPQRLWFGGERGVLASILLDALAWLIVAGLGILAVRASRTVESWLAALQAPGDPSRPRLWMEAALLFLAVTHLLMWGLSLPWPHRFSATMLAVGLLWWLLTHPGRRKQPAGRWLGRLLPETRGRGLWGDSGRRRLLKRLVVMGGVYTSRVAGAQRTEWNVRDSDGTVIFSIAPGLTGGSKKTLDLAEKHHKPVIHLSRQGGSASPEEDLLRFLRANRIKVLNVAGPRASKEPEISKYVREVLDRALRLSGFEPDDAQGLGAKMENSISQKARIYER